MLVSNNHLVYESFPRAFHWLQSILFFVKAYETYPALYSSQARRRGGFEGFERAPLEVNNGGLKTQTVDF